MEVVCAAQIDMTRSASARIEKARGPWWSAGFVFGGASRIRTDDLVGAIHALCQLSYSPICAAHLNEGVGERVPESRLPHPSWVTAPDVKNELPVSFIRFSSPVTAASEGNERRMVSRGLRRSFAAAGCTCFVMREIGQALVSRPASWTVRLLPIIPSRR